MGQLHQGGQSSVRITDVDPADRATHTQNEQLWLFGDEKKVETDGLVQLVQLITSLDAKFDRKVRWAYICL